jgi:hypothetical protein
MAASDQHRTWAEANHIAVEPGGVALEEPQLVDDLAVPMTDGWPVRVVHERARSRSASWRRATGDVRGSAPGTVRT